MSSLHPNSPDDHDDRTVAADWLIAHDRGLTAGEQAEFEQWLREPAHARAWAEAQRAWSALDRLAELQPAPAAPVSARWTRWAMPLGAAAAMLTVGLFVFFHRLPQERNGGPQAVQTAPRTLVLSDGSRVELNGDAAVVERFTTAERRVQLRRGEAHFTVTKNTARPFIVEADGVAVRAVGTAFNVRLDAAAVEVLVTEGQVRVGKHASSQSSDENSAAATAPAVAVATAAAPVLGAGERAIASRDPARTEIAVTKVSAGEMAQLLAWQSLQLKFQDLPLAQVAAQFNRHNRTQLIVDPGAVDTLVAGSFRAENVDLFVRFLEEAFQISAERRDDGAIVLRKAAP